MKQYFQNPDRGLAARALLGVALARGGRRFLRLAQAPGLAELADSTSARFSSAELLVRELGLLDAAAPNWEQIAEEHDRVAEELKSRYTRGAVPYPTIWAVESQTALLLYSCVRILRPQRIIEVGVGNGASTFMILSALAANGSGELESFDIFPDAGALVSGSERSRWRLHVVDRDSAATSLAAGLRAADPAEMCFHDAGHDYLSQYPELKLLWAKTNTGGLLICDDANTSFGAMDFGRDLGIRSSMLLDSRKAITVYER